MTVSCRQGRELQQLTQAIEEDALAATKAHQRPKAPCSVLTNKCPLISLSTQTGPLNTSNQLSTTIKDISSLPPFYTNKKTLFLYPIVTILLLCCIMIMIKSDEWLYVCARGAIATHWRSCHGDRGAVGLRQ